MAFSKFHAPPTAQHYLVCGTEDCEKNCQFYCNPCHRPLCEQCRDEHQKSPDTKHHEVVPYQQRKRQLPEVKCQIHVNRYVDMLCEQCQVPVCSKCATKDHGGHTFIDLGTVYAEKCAIFLKEIKHIEEYFLPTSQDLLKSTKTDSTDIKKIMDDIRESMKAEAESLKSMVDTVTSDKIEQVNKIEESLLHLLNSQEIKYDGYISYLHELVQNLRGDLSSKDIKTLMSDSPGTTNLNIDPIPKTTKPVPPVFTAGQYSKEDITKLLGRVTAPDTKPENREIKPMETSSTQLKPEEKQRKQNREKSDVKQTLSLTSSVTKVGEYTVPGVYRVHHLSQGKSGTVWGSDDYGYLVQTDLRENRLQRIQTSGESGYHTVTQDGDLIFTDKENKVICKITLGNSIIEFIKTGDWEPISIHSSHINGDILVGMIKNREAKVMRYSKTGKEIQSIKRDNKGQGLYDNPHYITENINGDICTSDYNKRAVVAVNKSGQHRFSYTGQTGMFRPSGICTDLLGHILVCNTSKSMSPFLSFLYMDYNKIHLLDQDGQILSILSQQGIKKPLALCVDEENNLHVGQHFANTVTVFKYLQ